MSFSERHKDILMLLGGALALLFLVWLFYLRGNSARAEADDKKYQGEISGNISKYANKGKAAMVDKMHRDFSLADKNLEAAYEKMQKRMLWRFPEKLIPDDAMPQTYVRMRLRDERDYAARQLSTVKSIYLNTQAQLLGMELPTDVQEERSVDEAWMRQIIVLRRFIDVLLALPEEKPGEQPVLAIHELRPLRPLNTGTPPEFLREHPVEARLQMTLGGLSRLLAAFSTDKDSMHAVRLLEISAAPEERQTRFSRNEDRKKLERRTWFTHYYAVHLIVASVEALNDQEQAEQKAAAEQKSGNSQAIRRPLLH